jgi:hypothetical protein
VSAATAINRQNAVPFKSYWIMLADGRELFVDHPDFATVSEADDSLTIFDNSGGVEIVDLALVVSLRYGGERRSTKRR